MMKKIQAMDSGGRLVEAQVDELRYRAFDQMVQTTPQLHISPFGASAMDAGEAMSFLVSQLAYTEPEVFKKMYTPTQAEQFIPQKFDAGEAVDTIRYEVMDFVGDTDDESSKANATPTVDVAYAQVDFGVRPGQIGYEYSQHDLRVTAFLRKPLPEAKLAAAIDVYKRRMNKVGLFGRAEYGLQGLANNTLVPHSFAPYGNWTGTTDTDQMLADLNYLLYLTWIGSANNEVGNQIILPPRAYTLAQARRIPNTQVTVLNFFLENNLAVDRGGSVDVDPGYGFDTAGPGGAPLAMAYVKDDRHVVQHIPLPLRFLAPQPEGVMIKIPGEYRYCGTHIRYVNSAVYMYSLVAAA